MQLPHLLSRYMLITITCFSLLITTISFASDITATALQTRLEKLLLNKTSLTALQEQSLESIRHKLIHFPNMGVLRSDDLQAFDKEITTCEQHAQRQRLTRSATATVASRFQQQPIDEQRVGQTRVQVLKRGASVATHEPPVCELGKTDRDIPSLSASHLGADDAQTERSCTSSPVLQPTPTLPLDPLPTSLTMATNSIFDLDEFYPATPSSTGTVCTAISTAAFLVPVRTSVRLQDDVPPLDLGPSHFTSQSNETPAVSTPSYAHSPKHTEPHSVFNAARKITASGHHKKKSSGAHYFDVTDGMKAGGMGVAIGLAPHLLCKAGISQNSANNTCTVAALVAGFLSHYPCNTSEIPTAVGTGVLSCIAAKVTMYFFPVHKETHTFKTAQSPA